MGRCRSGYILYVVVISLNLLSEGNTQSEDGSKRTFENAPSGISVEAEELRQGLSPGQKIIVNGPTAFSVEAEEKMKEVSTGFEEVEEDLRDSNDSTGPAFVESDVDLEKIDNDPDPPHFVNGHSGQSVHYQELEAAGNRKVISTDPKEVNKEEIRKGLHIYTTDWSRDSAQWSFKGGDWSMVTLPDEKNHPDLPAPPVPGPALVLVTENALKKAYASRKLEQLENVTLHYSYYLSEGEPPHGIPVLDVYQVKDDETRLVSSETNHGEWSDNTVSLPFSGDSKIVFVGRLNKKGNDIAIDDITIRGYSGSSNDEYIEVKEAENGTSGNETGNATTSSDQEGETKLESVDDVTKDVNSQEQNSATELTKVGATEKSTEAVQEQETNTDNSDNGEIVTTKEPDLIATNASILAQGNGTYNALSGNNPEIGNGTNITNTFDSVDELQQLNETIFPLTTDSSFKTDTPSINTDTDGLIVNVTNENQEGVSDINKYSNGSSEFDQTNLTTVSYISTDDISVGGEGNNSEISTVTNITPLVTEMISSNTTDFLYNSSNTTFMPDALDNVTSAMFNETGSELTTNSTNPAGYLSNNSTGEVNITVNSNISAILTTDGLHNVSTTNLPQKNTSEIGITTPLIIGSSKFPSGGINGSAETTTSTDNTTDISPGLANQKVGSSWSAFKIFLVICVLGVAVMGFLYWRRQRRRDDEIPVFSRTSHSDYLNPSFSDDDSNFASRGTSHNYKSFD